MTKYIVKVLFKTGTPLSQEAGMEMWRNATYFRALGKAKYDREVVMTAEGLSDIYSSTSDDEAFASVITIVMHDMIDSLTPFVQHPEDIKFLAFAVSKED